MATTVINKNAKRSASSAMRLLFLVFVLSPVSVQADYADAYYLNAVPTEAAQHSLLLDIAKVSHSTMAVGERGHIILSEDEGVSWKQVIAPTRVQLNAVAVQGTDKVWITGEDELIIQSADGGKTWNFQHEGIDAEVKGPLLDILFSTQEKGFAVGVFNKIFRTTNGGKQWVNWSSQVDNPDEWHLFAIAATGETADTLYISSEAGLLFKSEDNGECFHPIQTPHEGSFQTVAAYRGEDGSDRIVLAGVGGVIYVSENSAVTWNKIETGIETGLFSAVFLDDRSVLIAGQAGTIIHISPDFKLNNIYKTTDGLSLAGLIQQNNNKFQLIGFGGVKDFQLPD